MPNWCENILIVTGEEKEVQRFKGLAKPKKGDGDLSLSALYPMPKELEGTRSPALIVSDKEYAEKLKEAEQEAKDNPILGLNKPISESMSQQLIKKFGSNNWYDWSIRRWGIKWDVEATLDEIAFDYLEYRFDSPWSPPVKWLEKIAQDFPSLRFALKYDEPGMGFMGIAIAENGELIKDQDIDYA